MLQHSKSVLVRQSFLSGIGKSPVAHRVLLQDRQVKHVGVREDDLEREESCASGSGLASPLLKHAWLCGLRIRVPVSDGSHRKKAF